MKFVADRTLGKLAKKLRILGYDTLYYRSDDVHQLIHLARQEDRIILTRNTKLAIRRPKDRIITIQEDNPSRQLTEVVEQSNLSPVEDDLFSRCLLCNAVLLEIPRETAEGRVPDFIFHQQQDFSRCPQCERIYWQGSHLNHMKATVNELIQTSTRSQAPDHK